jgi:hypothetical protein
VQPTHQLRETWQEFSVSLFVGREATSKFLHYCLLDLFQSSTFSHFFRSNIDLPDDEAGRLSVYCRLRGLSDVSY